MKWLPSILSAVAALASVFSADLQGVIAAHPAVAGVLGALSVILAHVAPPPQK